MKTGLLILFLTLLAASIFAVITFRRSQAVKTQPMIQAFAQSNAAGSARTPLRSAGEPTNDGTVDLRKQKYLEMLNRWPGFLHPDGTNDLELVVDQTAGERAIISLAGSIVVKERSGNTVWATNVANMMRERPFGVVGMSGDNIVILVRAKSGNVGRQRIMLDRKTRAVWEESD